MSMACLSSTSAMALVSILVLMYGLSFSMADVKRQASIFTNPTINNFQSKNKDAYDCVDINKQPAFDHPLLKNHKIQMVPSFSTKSMENRSVSNIEIQNEGCPPGKVPIPKRQLEMEDFHQFTESQFGQHFATMQTKPGGTYYGARAAMNMLNPTVKMNQYSMALIWVQNGPAAELNSIQIGWGVHPRLYGDYQTRLTTYWTADGYKKTGCYDMFCPGFVQTHSTIFPGAVLEPNSFFDQIAELAIFQDLKTGNWLFIAQGFEVGYWPKELFTHLTNGASFVRYGGNTFISPDGISPPMGDGNFPGAHYDKDAGHFSFVKIVDNPQGNLVDVESSNMELYVDNEQCFKLNDFGFIDKDIRHAFGYGGPGGNCGL